MVPLLLIIVAIQIFFPYLNKVFERNESTILVAIKDEVFASMLIISQNTSDGKCFSKWIYIVHSQHILLCTLYCYIVSILHCVEILFLFWFQASNPILKIIFSSINSLQVPVNRNILKSRQYEKLNVIEMGTEFSE